MRLISFLVFLLFIISCKTHTSKSFYKLKDSLKNDKYYENTDFTNININNCSWLYKGKILSKKKMNELKNDISNKIGNIKIKIITTENDSLQKYHSNKACLVIIE